MREGTRPRKGEEQHLRKAALPNSMGEKKSRLEGIFAKGEHATRGGRRQGKTESVEQTAKKEKKGENGRNWSRYLGGGDERRGLLLGEATGAEDNRLDGGKRKTYAGNEVLASG